jgi:hypothetical protein
MSRIEDVAAELMKLGLDATIRPARDEISAYIVVFADDNTSNVPDATVWPPHKVPHTNWTWGPQFEHGEAGDVDPAIVAAHIKETLA